MIGRKIRSVMLRMRFDLRVVLRDFYLVLCIFVRCLLYSEGLWLNYNFNIHK